VILDNLGASYFSRNVDALAPDGRLAIVGFQGGTNAEVDLSTLMSKRATVVCTSLRSRPRTQKAEIVRSVRENVWPLVASGSVCPVIDRTLPITRVREAHELLEAGQLVGKVLLRFDEV
jgi:NADPH:quinone reductase-like Zn-dependent oxidoreductase